MRNIQRKLMAFITTVVMLFFTGTVAQAAEVTSEDIHKGEMQTLVNQTTNDVFEAYASAEVANIISGNLSKSMPNSGTVAITRDCNVYVTFYARAISGTGSATYKVNIGGVQTYVIADGTARTVPLGYFRKGNYSYSIRYDSGSSATYAFGLQLVSPN